MGVRPIDTTLPVPGEDLGTGVRRYLEGVDELVLRAVTPSGTVDELLHFVAAAAAAVHGAA
jgi:hypothetical protein